MPTEGVMMIAVLFSIIGAVISLKEPWVGSIMMFGGILVIFLGMSRLLAVGQW